MKNHLMFSNIQKALAWFTVVLILLSLVDVTLGATYYPESYTWDFQNYSYLNFNETINLADTPQLGIPYDNGLIGSWNMNEDSGLIANDSSGNGNTGTIYGASWMNGKFDNGLSFNGVSDYMSLPITSSTTFGSNDFSISCWFKVSNVSQYDALISNYVPGNNIFIRWLGSPLTLQFICQGNGSQVIVNSGVNLVDNQWHLVTAMRSGSNFSIYIDGLLKKSVSNANVGVCSSPTNQWLFMKTSTYVYYTAGYLDEVRFYNYSLSEKEIAVLYSQPSPVSLSNYYYFKSAATNSTLIIHIDNPLLNSTNIAIATCTNFFTDNKLVFQANNSITINLWTDHGQPTFTTGIWNSQNYTTTLSLDKSSIGKLDWNPSTPPSASSFLTNITDAGNTTILSALWTDSRSLSGGGYIFSTNNTGQWVNASWTAFSSNPCWGNVSLTLSSMAGLIVGFREYANNSLNIWGDSGVYNITTTNETLAPSPTLSPSSAPNASPTLKPTPNQNSSPSTVTPHPSLTPVHTPASSQNNVLSTQTMAIVASVAAVLVVLSTVAFKKGYISIEIVDEKVDDEDGNNEENRKESQDYMI